jgi:hypothetical protein
VPRARLRQHTIDPAALARRIGTAIIGVSDRAADLLAFVRARKIGISAQPIPEDDVSFDRGITMGIAMQMNAPRAGIAVG